MTLKQESPAVQGGAFECLAGRRDTSKDRANHREMQFLPGADECCWRLGRALRQGRLQPDDWSFNFVRSILRHSKRCNWEPSEKQLHCMRALVAELATPDAGSLIDDGGDDAAA